MKVDLKIYNLCTNSLYDNPFKKNYV